MRTFVFFRAPPLHIFLSSQFKRRVTLQSLLVSSRDAYVILGHPKVGRASRKPTRPFSKAPQSKMGWALAGPAARIGPHSHRAPKRDFALSHLHHSFSTHQFNVERFSFTCVCVSLLFVRPGTRDRAPSMRAICAARFRDLSRFVTLRKCQIRSDPLPRKTTLHSTALLGACAANPAIVSAAFVHRPRALSWHIL